MVTFWLHISQKFPYDIAVHGYQLKHTLKRNINLEKLILSTWCSEIAHLPIKQQHGQMKNNQRPKSKWKTLFYLRLCIVEVITILCRKLNKC